MYESIRKEAMPKKTTKVSGIQESKDTLSNEYSANFSN